jgi:hypothetical protein
MAKFSKEVSNRLALIVISFVGTEVIKIATSKIEK